MLVLPRYPAQCRAVAFFVVGVEVSTILEKKSNEVDKILPLLRSYSGMFLFGPARFTHFGIWATHFGIRAEYFMLVTLVNRAQPICMLVWVVVLRIIVQNAI